MRPASPRTAEGQRGSVVRTRSRRDQRTSAREILARQYGAEGGADMLAHVPLLGRAGRWWHALGIAVSVAANMLARYPDLVATAGPVVSAWPP